MAKLGRSISLTDIPFITAFICVFISFVFYLISFSSPYWIVSYEHVYNPFRRMGLWSVCYDKYIHPKDYVNNKFSGCYWIFSRIFYTKRFWEYINPRWLIAVQVLFSLGFIFQCISCICVVFYLILFGSPVIESTIAMYSQSVAVIFAIVSIVTFAFQSEDRDWMPRPDHNFLGFSFAFACIMIFYGLISIFFLVLVNQGDKSLKAKNDYQDYVDNRYAKSVMTQAKSNMMQAPASYYAGSGSKKQLLAVNHGASEPGESILSGSQQSGSNLHY